DGGARGDGRGDPRLGARRDTGLAGRADDLDQQAVRVHADAPALGAGDADVQPSDAPPGAGARDADGGRHRHRADGSARAAAARCRVSRRMRRAQHCGFGAESDPWMVAYHDEEWGVPIHDDRRWYEKLTLDGAQAGLSWMTILKKREANRDAFRAFDAKAVARFGDRDVERLMKHAGIVRNRLKIKSAIGNARALLAIAADHGSIHVWIVGYIGGKPIPGKSRGRADMPARTPRSDEPAEES